MSLLSLCCASECMHFLKFLFIGFLFVFFSRIMSGRRISKRKSALTDVLSGDAEWRDPSDASVFAKLYNNDASHDSGDDECDTGPDADASYDSGDDEYDTRVSKRAKPADVNDEDEDEDEDVDADDDDDPEPLLLSDAPSKHHSDDAGDTVVDGKQPSSVFVLPPAPATTSTPGTGPAPASTQGADVMTNCTPSELDVLYGLHLHPLHFSHVDPTSARLKVKHDKPKFNNKANGTTAAGGGSSSNTSKDDDKNKGKDEKMSLPTIVFGPEDKPIDVILTQQGRCNWDSDLVWGNYVDPLNSHRVPGKFDSTDKAKFRISVDLMYPDKAPMVQFLSKVHETIMHKIIEEKDPSMLHITQPIYDDAKATYSGLGLDPKMVEEKIMEKYRKDVRALFNPTFAMKEDRRFGWGAGIRAGMSASGKLTKRAEEYLLSEHKYGNPPVWPHSMMADLFKQKVTYLAADLPVTRSEPMPPGARAPVARLIKFQDGNDSERFIKSGTNVALQVQMRVVKNLDTGGFTFSYLLKAVHICGTEFNGESGSNRVGGEHGDPLAGFAIAE